MSCPSPQRPAAAASMLLAHLGLENISGVIRGRFRFQRKVKTYSAEGRMSAWVLAMVPLVLFGTLWIVTPDYLPVLLEDPRGINMLTYAFISGVIGIFWIRNICF